MKKNFYQKYLISATLIFCAIITGYSQNSPLVKFYQHDELSMEGNCVEIYNSSELIIAGRVGNDALIMITDLDGNVNWSKQIQFTSDMDIITDLTIHGNDLYLIGHSNLIPRTGFAAKIDLNSQSIIWEYLTEPIDADVQFRDAAFDDISNLFRIVGQYRVSGPTSGLFLNLYPSTGLEHSKNIYDNSDSPGSSDDFFSIYIQPTFGLHSSFVVGRSMISGAIGQSRPTFLHFDHLLNQYGFGGYFFDNQTNNNKMYGIDIDNANSGTIGDAKVMIAMGDENNDGTFESYLGHITDGGGGTTPGQPKNSQYKFSYTPGGVAARLKFREIIPTMGSNNLSYVILASVNSSQGGPYDHVLIGINQGLGIEWSVKFDPGGNESFTAQYNSQLAYDAVNGYIYFIGKTDAYHPNNQSDIVLYKVNEVDGKSGYICGEDISIGQHIVDEYKDISFNESEPEYRVNSGYELEDLQISNFDKCQCFKFSDFRYASSSERNALISENQEVQSKVFTTKLDFTVYPNPFDNLINIEVHDPETKITELRVVNVLGETSVFMSPNSEKVTLSTIEFKSGLYFIKIIDSKNNNYSSTIIKQ